MSINQAFHMVAELHKEIRQRSSKTAANFIFGSAYLFFAVVLVTLISNGFVPYWLIVVSAAELGFCFGIVKLKYPALTG